jgi:hypothetical protein
MAKLTAVSKKYIALRLCIFAQSMLIWLIFINLQDLMSLARGMQHGDKKSRRPPEMSEGFRQSEAVKEMGRK